MKDNKSASAVVKQLTETGINQTSHQKIILRMILLTFLVLGILILLIIGFKKFQPKLQNDEARRQQQLSLQKAEATIAAIEKLIELPDEEPTVATINDLSKLQGQPFFAKAEAGDQVLFFTQAQKAILYRPTANKIIEVSALEMEN